MLRTAAAAAAVLAFVGAFVALAGGSDRIAEALTLLGLIGLSFVVLVSVAQPPGPSV